MSDDSTSDASTRSFEDQLKALEQIVDTLENEMPPLEEALQSYEAGVDIARDCLARLDKAELRIRELKIED